MFRKCKCIVYGVLFLLSFSSICFSQDIDDIFDLLVAQMIRTNGNRYTIEEVLYDIPIAKDKSITLKWDVKDNGVYEKTYKMTFLLPMFFTFNIDSKKDYCGVIIKYENLMDEEGDNLLARLALAQMLTCYDKNKPEHIFDNNDPLKMVELGWYDCDTAYKIKQLFKLAIEKIGERDTKKNKK